MASVNQTRGTPGIILCLFTTAVVLSTLAAWENRLRKAEKSNIEQLSALGDHAFYAITGDEDLNAPHLVFPQQPRGIFRRGSSPVPRDDGRMLRVAVEKSGRWNVYSDGDPMDKPDMGRQRFFLKSGDGEYFEFGERNHWPEFSPLAK